VSRRAKKELVEEHALMSECVSCGQEDPQSDCSKSKRPCGHHCNHSWTHDECCWCGEIFGEEGLEGKETFEHWMDRAAAYAKEINLVTDGSLLTTEDIYDVVVLGRASFESGATPKAFIRDVFAADIAELDVDD
jgi:hypothetical protein